nr:sulfatase [uncultured Sphingorhabdus sp.]
MSRRTVSRREALSTAGAAAAVLASPPLLGSTYRKPNVIVVLADDLGYGDLRSYGGRVIKTPELDRMARAGARLTSFYASANLCTPSRAGLLTGRYPIRTGLAKDVIFSDSNSGLPLSEITIPELLKPDYRSALIGKWHLGHISPYWPPTVHGFDEFFGLPYSHDMKPLALYDQRAPGVELTSEDVVLAKLSERFFDRAHRFVEENAKNPFFLLLALTAPHLPLDPHPNHAGHSAAADYGDVVEEVDVQMGRLLGKLRKLGIDRDTLVLFTSDNGPWLVGSSGPLRDRKGGGGWEGGYRVPLIAHMPGKVRAGLVSDAIAMNFDILPTIAAMANIRLPAGVAIDGRDLSKVLSRNAPSPHDELILFNNEDVSAVRTDRWKCVVRAYYREYDWEIVKEGYPLLFDVKADPSEIYSVATKYPDVMKAMMARVARAKSDFASLHARPPSPN